jgi:hypothetical protein
VGAGVDMGVGAGADAGVEVGAAMGCVGDAVGRRGKRERATFRAAWVSAGVGRVCPGAGFGVGLAGGAGMGGWWVSSVGGWVGLGQGPSLRSG